MSRQVALQIIMKHLPDKRQIHTIGLTNTAITLAKQYGADEKKAEIAGIFHDYAKYRPKQEMIDIINEEDLPKDLLMYSSELWHAPVGAILVKKEIGITDEDILR